MNPNLKKYRIEWDSQEGEYTTSEIEKMIEDVGLTIVGGTEMYTFSSDEPCRQSERFQSIWVVGTVEQHDSFNKKIEPNDDIDVIPQKGILERDLKYLTHLQ